MSAKSDKKVEVSESVGSEVVDGVGVCALVGLGVSMARVTQPARKSAYAMKTIVFFISLSFVFLDRRVAFSR